VSPRFNRFGKRFGIGIATFGRARYVPKPDPDHNAYFGLMLYSDLTPVDIPVVRPSVFRHLTAKPGS